MINDDGTSPSAFTAVKNLKKKRDGAIALVILSLLLDIVGNLVLVPFGAQACVGFGMERWTVGLMFGLSPLFQLVGSSACRTLMAGTSQPGLSSSPSKLLFLGSSSQIPSICWRHHQLV